MTITPEEIIQLRNLCDPVTGPPWLPRLLSAYETEKAAREQERNRFVSGASAERYWEARWRDEKARADRLAKALRPLVANVSQTQKSDYFEVRTDDLLAARAALAEEPKT